MFGEALEGLDDFQSTRRIAGHRADPRRVADVDARLISTAGNVADVARQTCSTPFHSWLSS